MRVRSSDGSCSYLRPLYHQRLVLVPSRAEDRRSPVSNRRPLVAAWISAAGKGGISPPLPKRRNRLLQAHAEVGAWAPAQQGTRPGDVGTPLLGIVFRERLIGNLAVAGAELADQVGQLEDRDLGWISNVDGIAVVNVKQT